MPLVVAQHWFLLSTAHNVARFDKTRIPHTSNSLTLITCNLTTQYAIDQIFSHNAVIALYNNRSKCDTDSTLLH